MEMFLVGGAVRDELLGRPSKDLDFTVVLSGNEDAHHTMGGHDPFRVMEAELRRRGFHIHKAFPKFFTIKGRFPREQGHPAIIRSGFAGRDADFVLARKERGYDDGRRPDEVEVGTLHDDLARRDFTINAIAKDRDGALVDFFGGVKDLQERRIKAVGKPFDRFMEDALRAVRAFRFSVTLGFDIDRETAFAMQTQGVLHQIENRISDERIAAELDRAFAHDTMATLNKMQEFPLLTGAMLSGKVSLMPTMKERKR